MIKNKNKMVIIVVLTAVIGMTIVSSSTVQAQSNPTITLNPISTPLTTDQTNVAFSGTFSSGGGIGDIDVNWFNGLQIQLQISNDGSTGWTQVAEAPLSNGDFSGTFTAPSSAGIYYYRVEFPETHFADPPLYFTIGTSSVPQAIVVGPEMTVPEYAWGGLVALGACFMGLIVVRRKSLRKLI